MTDRLPQQIGQPQIELEWLKKVIQPRFCLAHGVHLIEGWTPAICSPRCNAGYWRTPTPARVTNHVIFPFAFGKKTTSSVPRPKGKLKSSPAC